MSPRNRNRLKLIGIGVLALAPVLGSYLLYWFWLPTQHTNYGTLIEPKRIPQSELKLADATPFTLDQLRGRWVFVVIDGAACGPRCQAKLWQIRQVRQAQGKELMRIERVWLIDDDRDLNAAAVKDFAGTWMVRAPDASLLAAFPAERSNRDHIYLVDPLGHIMMRFPAMPDPKRMMKDLGRLLKYSRSG